MNIEELEVGTLYVGAPEVGNDEYYRMVDIDLDYSIIALIRVCKTDTNKILSYQVVYADIDSERDKLVANAGVRGLVVFAKMEDN